MEYVGLQVSGRSTYTSRSTVFSGLKDGRKMSFTDAIQGTSGSGYGFNDWQDGGGCNDEFSPYDQRGYSSFVMIR